MKKGRRLLLNSRSGRVTAENCSWLANDPNEWTVICAFVRLFRNNTPLISLLNTQFHNYISTTQGRQEKTRKLPCLWSLSITNQSTYHEKKPATLDAGQRMIVNSNIRSVNKYFKSWMRLATASWLSHQLFGKSDRRIRKNQVTSMWLETSHLGEGLGLKTNPTPPWKTAIGLDMIWGRCKPWTAALRTSPLRYHSELRLEHHCPHSANIKTNHFTGLWVRHLCKIKVSEHPLLSLKKFYGRDILLVQN